MQRKDIHIKKLLSQFERIITNILHQYRHGAVPISMWPYTYIGVGLHVYWRRLKGIMPSQNGSKTADLVFVLLFW